MKSLFVCFSVAAMLLAGSAGAQTSRNRNRSNFNINMQGDADSCAGLKISSNNGELAQAAEKFDLQRSDVAVLELNGAERGSVRVRGWKQPGYSVEACKIAVASDRAAASSLVSGIAVSRSAGRFSFTGPSTDNGNWQVYFIIHAPDNAALDLETRNAPVSIQDVNGNIKVRATNGPVSLSRSSGNIDAQSTNGPISFDGESGDVHLRAVNGPVSVRLGRETWSGPALEARSVNGPMSLSLPDAFQSGIRVETGSASPLSCRHELCSHATTDQTSDSRVMRLNGSSDTVRIYTENGPLSVSSLSKVKKVI
jgi:hypothetical protein